jgi:hypothetical protein
MKNDKLKNYALGLMLLLVLGAISAVAQTGRRQERQLEPQQQQAAPQIPDQHRMPQRQAQTDRYDRQDRGDDRRDDRRDRWDDRKAALTAWLTNWKGCANGRNCSVSANWTGSGNYVTKIVALTASLGILTSSVSSTPWATTTGLATFGATVKQLCKHQRPSAQCWGSLLFRLFGKSV